MTQTKRRRGRPRRMGANLPLPQSAEQLAPTLPPAHPESLMESSPDSGEETPRHVSMTRPPTKKESMGMTIVAMRLAGMTEDEIATKLGYTRSTLAGYVYLAGKNGWLDLPTVKEAINYNLLPTVVKRLYEGLHSEGVLATGMPVRQHMALKIAEGTIFKEYDKTESSATAIVALKIEMPQGAMPVMREDTMGGTPAFVDAEIVERA